MQTKLKSQKFLRNWTIFSELDKTRAKYSKLLKNEANFEKLLTRANFTELCENTAISTKLYKIWIVFLKLHKTWRKLSELLESGANFVNFWKVELNFQN